MFVLVFCVLVYRKSSNLILFNFICLFILFSLCFTRIYTSSDIDGGITEDRRECLIVFWTMLSGAFLDLSEFSVSVRK